MRLAPCEHESLNFLRERCLRRVHMRQARASAAGFAQRICRLGTLMIELGAQVEPVLERQCFLVLPDRPLARSCDLDLLLSRRLNVGHPAIHQCGAVLRHCKVSDRLAPFGPDMSFSGEELRVTLLAKLRSPFHEEAVILLVHLTRLPLILKFKVSLNN